MWKVLYLLGAVSSPATPSIPPSPLGAKLAPCPPAPSSRAPPLQLPRCALRVCAGDSQSLSEPHLCNGDRPARPPMVFLLVRRGHAGDRPGRGEVLPLHASKPDLPRGMGSPACERQKRCSGKHPSPLSPPPAPKSCSLSFLEAALICRAASHLFQLLRAADSPLGTSDPWMGQGWGWGGKGGFFRLPDVSEESLCLCHVWQKGSDFLQPCTHAGRGLGDVNQAGCALNPIPFPLRVHAQPKGPSSRELRPFPSHVNKSPWSSMSPPAPLISGCC